MIIVVLSKDPTHFWFVPLSPLVPLGHTTPQHTAQGRSDGGEQVEPDATAGTAGVTVLVPSLPY